MALYFFIHFREIKICDDKALSPLFLFFSALSYVRNGIYVMKKIPYGFRLNDIWNCDVKCGHDKMYIWKEHILTCEISSVLSQNELRQAERECDV